LFDARRRQGLTVIGVRVVGAGLALVAQILAARMIGPEDFGRYSLLLVWLLLMGHGATVGTNQLICRFLSQYLEAGERHAAAGLLRAVFGVVACLAGSLALGAIGMLWLNPFGFDGAMVALGMIAFMAAPLLTLQDYLEAIARGMDKPTLGIAPAYVMRHLGLIVGLVGLLAMGESADAFTVMTLTIAGLAASCLLQYVLIRSHLKEALQGASPAFGERRKWLRAALPIALVDAAEVLFLNADVLILGLFLPPELVAFYFAATRLAQVLGYVPYGVSAVTAQRFAALSARGDRAGLQTMVRQAAVISSTLTAISAMALSILAAPLLGLFGEGFEAAALVVPLLCLGTVIRCLLGPGEDVLTMLGEERACSLSFMMALALNIALSFALVPLIGLYGAAIATAVSITMRSGLMAYFGYRRLGIILPVGIPDSFGTAALKGNPS
jgi:O-antigen/teichoic acid export membrane protein